MNGLMRVTLKLKFDDGHEFKVEADVPEDATEMRITPEDVVIPKSRLVELETAMAQLRGIVSALSGGIEKIEKKGEGEEKGIEVEREKTTKLKEPKAKVQKKIQKGSSVETISSIAKLLREAKDQGKQVQDITIEELPLSAKTKQMVIDGGIKNTGDALKITKREWRINYFKKDSYRWAEFRNVVSALGVEFAYLPSGKPKSGAELVPAKISGQEAPV